jgi:S-adenosylmethionine:tRNA ribosyltransferase-isomerase
MDASLLNYDFNPASIAQRPLTERDASKLLVLNKTTGQIEHRVFREIAAFFNPGDVLVLNDTKVRPARLFGRKATGGQVELLLLKKKRDNEWRVITRGIKQGKVYFERLGYAEILGDLESKRAVFYDVTAEELMAKIGKTPLPPYIKRDSDSHDKTTYQTVYAKKEGAIAAPTAGLHFTEELLKKIQERQALVKMITLYVGYGTFKPITASQLEAHKMDKEAYAILQDTADAVNSAKSAGNKIFAVGTTVTRTLESAFKGDSIQWGPGETEIFIYPGYTFKVIDALITNFHLPQSTPMALTAAFCGLDLLKKAYQEARQQNYRFFSYGDAMLIA